MRVCYLAHALFLHDYRFLYKLIERGYETYLIAYRDGEIPGEIRNIKGLKIIHRRPKYFKKFQKFLFATKVWDFRKIIKEIKPDVIHSGIVWKDGFLAALSGFHPHLSMPWDGEVVGVSKYPVFHSVIKYTLNHADMVTCDCEMVKKATVQLVGYPPEKIVVFPWGLELDRFNPGIDGSAVRKKLGWEKNKVLIMNRHFRPIYGHCFFIQALPKVIERHPEVRVILISFGPLEKKIRRMIKRLGLEKYIHFVGWVPLLEMPKYLTTSDIYVSASLMDGSSMSLLEAMACGLPVVVTDVPSNREWVKDGDNGYVVPRRNSEILSERIIQLLDDSALRMEMAGENLKITKEKADWNKNFTKLEAIYKELTNSLSKG